MTLIRAVQSTNVNNLTVISNNCGLNDWGVGILVASNQVQKLCISYLGRNMNAAKQYLSGHLSIEFIPQGTLAERIRCGGAGIPAFYSPTGVDTIIQYGHFPIRYNASRQPVETSQPRETRIFNNKLCVLESAIHGDVALIKAYKADTVGNLQFKSTAQNFNFDMATNASYTVVEADTIVPVGNLQPSEIHIPGIYVDAVIQSSEPKRFEVQPSYHKSTKPSNSHSQVRDIIAQCAARELKHNSVVNLGVGIPTLVSKYITPDQNIFLHSENGVVGYAPLTDPQLEDYDSINASKEPIQLIPGSSVFSSSQSFAMIRGGHIDTTVLGAMQVSKHGDLANWITDDDQHIRGMGGAMDLVANSKHVIVTMEHTTKESLPKILDACTLPLTGSRCVDTIITDLATFDIDKSSGTLYLRELRPNVTLEQVRQSTPIPCIDSNTQS